MRTRNPTGPPPRSFAFKRLDLGRGIGVRLGDGAPVGMVDDTTAQATAGFQEYPWDEPLNVLGEIHLHR